jgi:hypothetical protein
MLKNTLVYKRKINKTTTILMTLMLLLTLIFTTVGCNNNDDGEDGADTALPESVSQVDADAIVNPDRSLFYGETLTIAVFTELFLDSIARLYEEKNPGVNIELISFSGDFWEQRERISVELMAGSGPVLMGSVFIDYLDPRVSHFLVDWLPIMNADPNFNEEDWFMNVFHATKVDGRLPILPMEFVFDMVVANSAVPGLTEALADMDAITVPEMMRLHQEIETGVPLYLDPNFDASWITTFCLDDFIDIETGWVDFDNERFIGLISHAREITNQDKWMFGGWQSSTSVSPQEKLEMSERYFFHTINGNSLFQHIINFDSEHIFTELTPLVNEQGELQMEPWSSYALNANASPVLQALAWDFIQFINNVDNHGPGLINIMPTNRELFRFSVERNMINDIHIFNDFGWQVAEGTDAEEDLIASLTMFAEMPMTSRGTVPDAILTTIFDILEQFNDGLITAEQAASDLQNRITLIFAEMNIR